MLRKEKGLTKTLFQQLHFISRPLFFKSPLQFMSFQVGAEFFEHGTQALVHIRQSAQLMVVIMLKNSAL